MSCIELMSEKFIEKFDFQRFFYDLFQKYKNELGLANKDILVVEIADLDVRHRIWLKPNKNNLLGDPYYDISSKTIVFYENELKNQDEIIADVLFRVAFLNFLDRMCNKPMTYNAIKILRQIEQAGAFTYQFVPQALANYDDKEDLANTVYVYLHFRIGEKLNNIYKASKKIEEEPLLSTKEKENAKKEMKRLRKLLFTYVFVTLFYEFADADILEIAKKMAKAVLENSFDKLLKENGLYAFLNAEEAKNFNNDDLAYENLAHAVSIIYQNEKEEEEAKGVIKAALEAKRRIENLELTLNFPGPRQ